jgi:pSer/pThr/pTyr-binding forkhead associated (FHA) protein
MKAELVPDNGGPPIPITRDVTVVGRREFCDVQLDHPSLSKRHAVLIKTEGLLILRDLISTNGTKVKGQRIRWAALLPDDRISFGTLKFRVYLGSDDAPSPSERPRLTANGKGTGRPDRTPVAFAAPSPLSVPIVPSDYAPRPKDNVRDSDDWRNAMSHRPKPSAPVLLNEHELIIEDDGLDAIVDLDDEIIDLH